MHPHMLVKMVVISLSQVSCNRTHSRPNKDGLDPAGHIALTSRSFHTVLLKALKCNSAWITTDRTHIKHSRRELMYISKHQTYMAKC